MSQVFTASAPGKVVLLGEHAVVYGKPAVAIAINKRVRTKIRESKELMLNDRVIDFEYHPHASYILPKFGLNTLSMKTDSEIPPSSGLGSSAAFCSSLTCATMKMKTGKTDINEIAKIAFEAEYGAQGRASPIDTFTSTLGGALTINSEEKGKEIAAVEKNGNIWHISSAQVPRMTLVIGYTGIKASTAVLVEKVKKYKDKNSFAKEIIDEIGTKTESGIKSLVNNDLQALGKTMTETHKLLSILGVSCNELNKLVDSSLRYSYGAKLTGAGGGGCMIALTDTPKKVCEAIEMHGGQSFVVETTNEGVKME